MQYMKLSTKIKKIINQAKILHTGLLNLAGCTTGWRPRRSKMKLSGSEFPGTLGPWEPRHSGTWLQTQWLLSVASRRLFPPQTSHCLSRERDVFFFLPLSLPLSFWCFNTAAAVAQGRPTTRPLTSPRSSWLWGRPSCWPGLSGAWRRPSWPTWRAPASGRPSRSPSQTRLSSPRWPAGRRHSVKVGNAQKKKVEKAKLKKY